MGVVDLFDQKLIKGWFDKPSQCDTSIYQVRHGVILVPWANEIV